VRTGRVWARLLGLGAAVVEEVNFGDEGEVVVAARPRFDRLDRCGVCRRRCPGFDFGEGRRRWRALDLGTTLAYVEADAPRVRCPVHGVVVCAVPWARHGSRFTRAFEDQATWLAVQCSKRAVAELLRIAWRTVGSICERVAAEAAGQRDPLAGLSWIGIDEISHRKGQRYLTVVVCHHTGRLVWAAAGRDRRTVEAFLDALGPERCEQIELARPTWRPGSPPRSPSAARTRSAAWTPSTSWRSRPTRSTRSAARSETRPAGPARRPSRASSRARASRSGRTREPHPPPESQALERPADQPAALPRLPAQGATARDLPRPGRARRRAAGRLASVGASQPPAAVRQARAHDQRAAPRDRSRDRERTRQRPRRSRQHQDPPDHAASIRISLAQRPDRTRHAHPRSTLPNPPRTTYLTHGNVTRPLFQEPSSTRLPHSTRR